MDRRAAALLVALAATSVLAGADTGVRERATGFFHVAKIDGRDWAIDSAGNGVVLAGVDHVQPWGMFCESLNYSPYGRHVKENYPSLDAWGDETIGRLKEWGFTMLGAGCDTARLSRRGLAHTLFLNIGGRLAHSGDKDKAISEGRNAPGTAFPNVFHPEFEAECDKVAAKLCAPNKNDPWLVGYFIDNELRWWHNSNRTEGMFDLVMGKPATHSAKKALVRFLGGRKATRELKVEFLRLVAERYFKVTTEAIRRHDPNHMVLGCRFAGLDGAHETVWHEAAKYCDLVTFNCYPWADIDRNVVLTEKGGEPLVDCLRRFHKTVGRPMMITEWSFPALDAGRPCLYGAGQRFRTQHERVQASELFAKTVLAMPFIVGYDYFMWVDEPAAGLRRSSPEDSNYGLVRENGEPYAELVGMFAKLHRDAARWRMSAPPSPRKHVPKNTASESERFFAQAHGDGKKISFTRDGDRWTLSNDVGIRLEGCIGSPWMVEMLSCDGVPLGRYGAMVMTSAPEWIGTSRLLDVSFELKRSCGIVTLSAEGERGGLRFTAVHRLALAPGTRNVLADIVSLANTGTLPISMTRLFMNPAPVEDRPGEVGIPPNQWKGCCEAYWALSGERTYGVFSHDESALAFRLWVASGGKAHSDIIFKPEKDTVVLSPGDTYVPRRPMSAVLTFSRR